MPQAKSTSDRPGARSAKTLGSTPQSGVSPTSRPHESLDLEEKVLDEAQLRFHLNQLAELGEALTVSLKESQGARPRSVTLEDLIVPLVENRAFGGQVQFTYAGQRWLDTLIATSAGVRMVRIQLGA